MQHLILFVALSVLPCFAQAQPIFRAPEMIKDPCYKVLVEIAELIERSSKNEAQLSRIELNSALNERVYTMRFAGLIGSYNIVLDNDANNRCFILENSFKIGPDIR